MGRPMKKFWFHDAELGILSEATYNGAFTVERYTKRPWPVDPRQYPLRGPSRGTVYAPPLTIEDDPKPPRWASIFKAAFNLLLYAFMVIGFYAISTGAFYLVDRIIQP